MNSKSSTMNTQELLKVRGHTYGETWKLAGMVIGLLREQYAAFVKMAPWMVYAWVQILGKLIRILYSPYNIDTWNDIIGYATLVTEEIEKD